MPPDTGERGARTLVVVDMEPGITVLPSVYLRPRTGLVDRAEGGDWLAGRDCRRVELESTALSERCDLGASPCRPQLRVALNMFADHRLAGEPSASPRVRAEGRRPRRPRARTRRRPRRARLADGRGRAPRRRHRGGDRRRAHGRSRAGVLLAVCAAGWCGSVMARKPHFEHAEPACAGSAGTTGPSCDAGTSRTPTRVMWAPAVDVGRRHRVRTAAACGEYGAGRWEARHPQNRLRHELLYFV